VFFHEGFQIARKKHRRPERSEESLFDPCIVSRRQQTRTQELQTADLRMRLNSSIHRIKISRLLSQTPPRNLFPCSSVRTTFLVHVAAVARKWFLVWAG